MADGVVTRSTQLFIGGVCAWNHATVRALFGAGNRTLTFCTDVGEAVSKARACGGTVIAWASRLRTEDEAACQAAGLELIRIEDGFIRSVGLGAGFIPAASLAIDRRGIYYDATRPSDMEVLLHDKEISAPCRRLGAQIRARLIAARLSKYNLSQGRRYLDFPLGTKEVILVPGQVSDDASIRKGRSATIDLQAGENINLQLLREVRARNRWASIVYKPHPDVAARLRDGSLPAGAALQYADAIVDDVDIITLIDVADRIETISSLAGFEALLRGKRVVTHGTPFYAGWGLTTDLTPLPDRGVRRTIDELAYVAFCQYTRHVCPRSGQPCDALALIDGLVGTRRSRLHHVRVRLLEQAARICERLSL